MYIVDLGAFLYCSIVKENKSRDTKKEESENSNIDFGGENGVWELISNISSTFSPVKLQIAELPFWSLLQIT